MFSELDRLATELTTSTGGGSYRQAEPGCSRQPCQLFGMSEWNWVVQAETLTAEDAVGLLVRDLNAEFLRERQQPSRRPLGETNLLNGHHHLNGIQAVQPEVIGEVGGRVDLLLFSNRPSFGHRLVRAAGTDLAGIGNLQSIVISLCIILYHFSRVCQDARHEPCRSSSRG